MRPIEIDVNGVAWPNVPLQLVDAAKKLNIKNFRCVFLRDELPKVPREKECGILNLDGCTGGGTHWVAWIKRASEKLYFDSYGLPPPKEILKYLRSPVFYNSERVQPDNEVFCGHLCLFILKKTSGTTQLHYSFQDVINGLH